MRSDKYIKWPYGAAALKTEDDFEKIAGMPYVLGAIDGCHVKVKAPSRMQADYLDRTLHHSVTLLAVCDVEKRFTFISAGFPGSAHDSRVFKNSVLYEKIKKEPSMVFPTQKHYIIGDSAFPLLEHLLVPFRKSDNLACNRKKFNKVLSQTCSSGA